METKELMAQNVQDPAQAGEGFTDAIEVDVCFENGRTLSGRIKIEWADGSFRAHFETDG